MSIDILAEVKNALDTELALASKKNPNLVGILENLSNIPDKRVRRASIEKCEDMWFIGRGLVKFITSKESEPVERAIMRGTISNSLPAILQPATVLSDDYWNSLKLRLSYDRVYPYDELDYTNLRYSPDADTPKIEYTSDANHHILRTITDQYDADIVDMNPGCPAKGILMQSITMQFIDTVLLRNS